MRPLTLEFFSAMARMTPAQYSSVSSIRETSMYSVAQRQPGESQFTCAMQFSYRSIAKWSANQVLPAYRPVE